MRARTLESALRASGSWRGDVGEVIVWGPNDITQLRLGVYEQLGLSLGVKLATSSWYPVTHSSLRAIARKAVLDNAMWARPDDRNDDVVVSAYMSIDAGFEEGAATTWFADRLRDLRIAGLLVDIDIDGGVAEAPTTSPV
jgi:hypothetical protein